METIDISSRAFWDMSFQEREKSFARLRQDAPVSWHPPVEVAHPHDERDSLADTTKQTTTLTALALHEHPEQRD
jgi:hypothetical protein